MILFSAIFALADFNIVFVLTGGGPMNATHLFATCSLTVGILTHEISLGAAIGLILLSLPLRFIVVIVQLRMVRRAGPVPGLPACPRRERTAHRSKTRSRNSSSTAAAPCSCRSL